MTPSRQAVRAAWRAAILIAALVLPAVAVAAEVISPAPLHVRLTLYRGDALPPLVRALNAGQGLALVTETRDMELPAGPSRLVFQGVADTLIPQSVQIQGLPGRVRESDFDYDLLSPGALVARSIGRQVQLVRTNPGTGRSEAEPGVLRSGPHGVVLQTAQGVEALRCSGLPERLVFDRTPQGLAARPTLSFRTSAQHAGRYHVVLSYLATGFDWSASYVARVAPDGRSLALSGWLTLQNGASTGFADAPTGLVAGRLARTGDDGPVVPSAQELQAACWRSEAWWKLMQGAGVVAATARRRSEKLAMMQAMALPAPPPPPPPPRPMAKASDLGDYKFYTLPEPTTVAARQTKQVRFLDQPSVAFDRLYVYEAPLPTATAPQDNRTQITLALRNAAASGLGAPLPSGRVAMMAVLADGGPMFVAGDHLDDTPVGLPFQLSLGQSSQVQVATTARPEQDGSVTAGSPRAWSVEMALTNAGSTPVVVELRQRGADAIRLSAEDQPHVLDGGVVKWRVALAAHGSSKFHYAYRESSSLYRTSPFR